MAQRSYESIKSAVRALQVLELFDGSRHSVTVMDVVRGLDFPQSSTSNLLKCLVAEGYLTLDSAARHYSPSARLALMGSWASPRLFRHGTMLRLLDDLAEQSQETAILASRSGLALRHIQAVGEDPPACLASGSLHAVMGSALGHALLSTLDAADIRKLVHRYNADKGAQTPWLLAQDMLTALQTVRSQGYAAVEQDGYGIVAVLLPGTEGEQLALGLAAKGRLEPACIDQRVRALRRAVAAHIGPVARPTYAWPAAPGGERRQAAL